MTKTYRAKVSFEWNEGGEGTRIQHFKARNTVELRKVIEEQGLKLVDITGYYDESGEFVGVE